MFIRIFGGFFFGFVWLVSFSNRTHVAVPISFSPLVAFAPAGESEMGTKERGCSEKEAVVVSFVFKLTHYPKKRLHGNKER